MTHKIKYIFLTLMGGVLWLQSCDDNPFDIPLENPRQPVTWLHLETDFPKLATKPSFQKTNDSLAQVYGEFYTVYTERVMRFAPYSDPYFEPDVMRFLTHKDIHTLHKSVDSIFHDTKRYQDDLEGAMAYYAYYFPNKTIPKVVSMVTALNNNIVVTDSVLGVGLDMYLGDSSYVYQMANIPLYLRKNANPKNMVYDMMRGWVLSEFEPKTKKDDFLSQMVHYGKALYIMDALFPNGINALKIGYSPEELAWCESHEATIWAKLIEDQMLFSTDIRAVRALTGPAPFTSGFPKESPGQLAYWVGWQIVRAYMASHPETTLLMLTEIDDAQLILRQSKYKPR